MIRMICGSTQVKGKLYTSKSGPFEASPESEARLVSRGVAEYVGETPTIAPAFPMGDDAAELPPVPVQQDDAPPVPVPDEAETVEEEVNAADLTVAQLKDIAAQMGIETKGLRTKAALLEAIEAAKPPDPQVAE